MSNSPLDTPATKVVCVSEDCVKEYARKGSMKVHFKKCHKEVEEIPSPLGRFPPSSHPKRLLFDNDKSAELAATQGNSNGEINSPKIISNAMYQCNKCDTEYSLKNTLNEHIKEKHDQDKEQHDPLFPEGDNNDLHQFGEDSEIAKELNQMARKVMMVSKCHECKLGGEVNQHQAQALREKESKNDSLERRQKKTDEKKN